MAEENLGYHLIVSQFYNSYHYFIVRSQPEGWFKGNLQGAIGELVQHKADGERFRGYLGDTDSEYYRYDRPRFNVNAAGDIYVIKCKDIRSAIYHIKHYCKHGYEGVRDKRTKAYEKSQGEISRLHRYDDLHDIIGKYFTIL